MKRRQIIAVLAIIVCMPAVAQDVNISTADTTNQTAKNIAIYNRVAAALQHKSDMPMHELVALS